MQPREHMIQNLLNEHTPQERMFTMNLALQLLNISGGKNIVETGTTRKITASEGAATVVFAKYVSNFTDGGKVWTVDVEEDAIEMCKTHTKDIPADIEYVVSCSVDFLKKFDDQIDLLYLDSLNDNGGKGGGREHQLEEAKAAIEKIHEKTIVLLDDTDIENFDLAHTTGGKGILSVPFFKSKGWTVVNSAGTQAVFINKAGWPELEFKE